MLRVWLRVERLVGLSFIIRFGSVKVMRTRILTFAYHQRERRLANPVWSRPEMAVWLEQSCRRRAWRLAVIRHLPLNSGLPVGAFISGGGVYDDARWATNWNVQTDATRTNPIESCPDRGGLSLFELFGCDPTGIYRNFRNARPGETGSEMSSAYPRS